MGPGVSPGPLAEPFDTGQQRGGLELPTQPGEVTGAAYAAPVVWS